MVARRLAEHGAVVIDADVLAREVVEPGTPALAAIAPSSAPVMLRADGTLDRAALGALIFSDAQKRETAQRHHPSGGLAAHQGTLRRGGGADPDAVVVYDVPLLVEAAGKRDRVRPRSWSCTPTPRPASSRMVELRGMTREEALHRLNSQATDAERLAIADVVIDTNGTLDDTLAQVDAAVGRQRRYRRGSRRPHAGVGGRT